MAEGTLIIIGGGEDKRNERVILREVARRLNGGKLVVATIASQDPGAYFDEYKRVFGELGVREMVELYIDDRGEALDCDKLRAFDGATGVFFSGGDQLRISSQIGDTPIEQKVREIFKHGGVIAGTSAGASVMSDTMLVRGSSGASYRIGHLNMAAGLGLIRNVIIDQHFAERGRIGRLLGAVAQNARQLGIGIDEDTAIIVEENRFRVIGSGAVYIVDCNGVTHCNIAEASPDRALSVYDVRLHVLSAGERFDLAARRPVLDPEPARSDEV
jgi:cyanophycinase